MSGIVKRIVRHLMHYNQWDIVVVPFPFINSNKSKPRPVLILNNESFSLENSYYLGAMITSSKRDQWYGDIEISNISEAGLSVNSTIRFKVFTLDERIIKRKIGKLSKIDTTQARKSISSIF